MMRFRITTTICSLLAFLSIFTFSQVDAQSLTERQERIRHATEKRDYQTALRELQNFRKADQRVFELNNYDYLLGRTASRLNDLATATTAFQHVVRRQSVLQDYALWHLSELWRASGNLMLERLFLEQLLLVAPDSSLAEAAALRIARSFYESKDYQSVINSPKLIVQSSKSKVQAQIRNPKSAIRNREWLVLVGQSHLRAGNSAEAREIFSQLITESPRPESPDDLALAAARGLDELDGLKPAEIGKIAPQITEGEHLRRAGIYQFNRAFEEAQMHYRAIDERYSNSPNLPLTLLQRGRIAVLEERFDKAIAHYQRLQNQFPNSTEARDALSAEASVYARTGNVDEAVSRYKLFIARYIDGAARLPENAERPFLNIIDALRDKGRDADALSWVAETRSRFKNQLPDALALFSQTRIHLSQGNWNSALQDLSELEIAPDLGGTRVPGGTNKTEIVFLKAFCFEQAGRFDEAISHYLAISDGRAEYYGKRATARLKNLAVNEKARNLIVAKFNLFRETALQAINLNDPERARQDATNALRLTENAEAQREMLALVERAYNFLPAYKNAPNGEIIVFGRQKLLEKGGIKPTQNLSQTHADEFLFLNLNDEAALELQIAEKRPRADSQNKARTLNSKTKDQSFNLAVISKRGDLANRAVGYAEPLWNNVPADYLVELAPRESIELLYPTPYSESLLEFARPREIDSRFLLAIMRQESRYRADVKSIAAARGLMQFIPATAVRIAGQLEQKDFALNDLYDPPIAILFGAQYLKDIFKEFPNQSAAVAASYNGGETNMMRWLLRSRSTDPDRYVAEIQFSQSKDYVYKVLANYDTYQTLYDERLQRK